jgi:beta-glucuronidase
MPRLFDTATLNPPLSLDGPWLLAFDSDNVGRKENWATRIPRHAERTFVPSCWNFHLGRFDYMGTAWYWRRVHLPEAGPLRLTFEAVSGEAAVYFDGKVIGRHYGGFTEFVCDAPKADAGEHLIAVRVTMQPNLKNTLPLAEADWYNYGGIYRGVTMERIDTLTIDRLHVRYNWKGDKPVNIRAAARLTNWTRRTLAVDLSAEFDGVAVHGQSIALEPRATVDVELPIEPARSPSLWSCEKPNLHTVRVIAAGVDRIERVGFRRLSTKGQQILLNGEPLRLLGVNRHNEVSDMGFAVQGQHIARDMAIIRDLGCNAVRGSHYPNDPLVLDYCDELGLVFWEEVAFWGHPPEALADDTLQERAMTMMEEMIERDFNHPSVILWSMQNESASDSAPGKKLFTRMARRARELDDSRLITYATNRLYKDRALDKLDVVAWNTYTGWYGRPADQWPETLQEGFEHLKKKGLDDRPFILSEFGAGGIYGDRSFDDNRKWSEDYQAKLLEHALEAALGRDDVAGVFIWQFCDIRTQLHGTRCLTRPRTFNNKGLVNEHRLPKKAYDLVKSIFHREPRRRK